MSETMAVAVRYAAGRGRSTYLDDHRQFRLAVRPDGGRIERDGQEHRVAGALLENDSAVDQTAAEAPADAAREFQLPDLIGYLAWLLPRV